MRMSYTTNVREVVEELNLAARDAKPAVVRALNRTIDAVKTRASREVRAAGYKLKAADIKKAIRINRATPGRMRADATASGRPIPLVQYGAKQTGKGAVSVDVLNGRKTLKHAFIATMTSGHTGVFERYGPLVVRTNRKRGQSKMHQQIRQLFGPGIPDALLNKAVEAALVDLINERFPVILANEHAWLSKRLKRKPSVPAD
jgi:hypothetical protein